MGKTRGKKRLIQWPLFWVLWLGGMIGVGGSLPYALTLGSNQPEALALPGYLLVIVTFVQNGVLLAIAIFIGLLLAPKVGLGAHILAKALRQEAIHVQWRTYIGLAVILGVITGCVIVGLDALFQMEGLTVEPEARPTWWQGLLASFYGGISEEILLRLFLMTLFVWLLSKIFKSKGSGIRPINAWIAIVLAAVIFGLAHLPALFAIVEPSALLIVRTILLNGIGGIVFGWLYWKKGLEAAMMTHFSTDIVLHVVIPLLSTY